MRKKRNMIRKTLEKELVGRNTTKCRTTIKNLKKSSQKEKAAIKLKTIMLNKGVRDRFILEFLTRAIEV